MIDRQSIIDEARRWIGTPSRTHGRNKFGIDCAGLISLTAQNVGAYMQDDTVTTPAASQIGLRFYSLMRGVMDEVPAAEAKIGSVLMFWKRRPFLTNHVGILVELSDFDDLVACPGRVVLSMPNGVQDCTMVGELAWSQVFAAFDYRLTKQANHRAPRRVLRGVEVVEHHGVEEPVNG
tara:strand:+ start:1169 stop:1702 length:534 start_codon:yes stop_codon:yes gene_type:complete